MATWEPDEIDLEDQYHKVDPIDDANLDESINELNESYIMRALKTIISILHRGFDKIK